MFHGWLARYDNSQASVSVSSPKRSFGLPTDSQMLDWIIVAQLRLGYMSSQQRPVSSVGSTEHRRYLERHLRQSRARGR